MKSLASLDKPLTEAELDYLESFLAKQKERDDLVMGLEELDGFLTALVISPETVMPTEYMLEIFGEELLSTMESEAEVEKVLGLIFRHFNTIADTLGKGEFYIPVFRKFEEVDPDVPCGNDWAHGFRRGLLLRSRAWEELTTNEEHGGALLPMMILDYEHDPDPELRPPPITTEKKKELLGFLGAGILHAYKYFQPHREREAQSFWPNARVRSTSARPKKSAATIPAPAAQAKNTSVAAAAWPCSEGYSESAFAASSNVIIRVIGSTGEEMNPALR